MAKNALDDYSTTAASNTDIDGLDSTGATGLVKSGDNYARSIMAHAKAKILDFGAVNTVAGTGDAITVTLASNTTALYDGMRFSINAPGTNTTVVTIAVSNSGATLLGTKKVRKWSGGAETALSAGDITSGHILNLVYDSARDGGSGAFMIDGTASVAAATTSAAGIVKLATAAEALDASSSALALTPASIATLIHNINHNAFKIADLEGVRLNMAGGIADAYDSQTDVDTGTSTNEDYDATNDLYAPTSATSAVSGATGTVIGDTITNGTGGNTPWDGDTSRTAANAPFNASGATTINIGKDWGLGNTKTITRFQVYGSSDNGFWSSSASQTCKLQGSTDNFSSSTVDLWTGTITDGTGLIHDQSSGITTTTAYRYHRLQFPKAGGENVYPVEIVLYEGTGVNNMTLVSNAFTASAVPTQARVAVFIDPQVSITINTDFTAEVSRDGGTTYTAVTLALVSNPVGTVEQYEGTVSISAQPSGTSMKYRLKTLNNKDIDVTGIVFQWA